MIFTALIFLWWNDTDTISEVQVNFLTSWYKLASSAQSTCSQWGSSQDFWKANLKPHLKPELAVPLPLYVCKGTHPCVFGIVVLLEHPTAPKTQSSGWGFKVILKNMEFSSRILPASGSDATVPCALNLQPVVHTADLGICNCFEMAPSCDLCKSVMCSFSSVLSSCLWLSLVSVSNKPYWNGSRKVISQYQSESLRRS